MKTADLCDRFHEELQICQPIFQSFGGRQRFSGRIATVKVLEDNVLVREALETIPPGSVLVVDGGGSKNCALMGDRLGGIAVSRGLAGVIINGCVRDSAELSEMDLGVLALAPMPLKSRKEGKGEREVPVEFGGVRWEPGHYVYADEDGVVISPREGTL
ncbi:regulator of ribonuclease activity A [Melghirimyces profundicolus]|uniref:4-hydroxy-4-methyl-2-oxoglutarate aldolase n=1 Tax=Melghirimyces profundicolus TaxID=1242148 RepID=A0A2T6BW12_9BACL|nr:ribonuclease E activity regulator RraA [Melghirimyces profundicolus]PTX60268.1 regulator of ribonuclease activity A [Melghirimyces profundicolus]